ncbi:MAG: T9SS type A sorting domain-containing protein [Bacteroidetes bacterium]|jgi:hypothetical protein|nr:T9SS type A sorting domain-containing protein [Bacteroidota bacterium]
MKRFLFIFGIAVPTMITAQVDFEKIAMTPEEIAQNFEYMITADIDGDGFQDIVASGDRGLSWYRNDGTGKFYGNRNLIHDFSMRVTMVAADFDNDGYTDIVVGSVSSNGTLAWFKNIDGQGNFGPMQLISNVNTYYPVLVAMDVDGDGDMDLIASSRSTGELVWYENLTGTGTFSQRKIIDAGVSAMKILLEDLDNDGRDDLIISNLSGVRWYKNVGGQTPFVFQEVIYSIYSIVDIAVSDLNGDGHKDIVILGSYLYWVQNNGNATSWTTHYIESDLDSVTRMIMADVDNDGKEDLLIKNINEIRWYKQEIEDGEIIFNSSTLVTENSNRGKGFIATDIDNDGNIDIINAGFNTSHIAWYLNNGSGTFDQETIVTNYIWSPIKIQTADINGDSLLDIVFFDQYQPKIVWLENSGNDTYFTPHFIDTNFDKIGSDLAVGDITNNGHIDVIASGQDGRLAWYENDGNGKFEKHPIDLQSNSNVLRVALVDLDGDGKLDIVGSTHEIFWLRNLGGGIFAERQIILSFVGGTSMEFYDISNNGLPDIIVGSGFHQDGIRYIENQGNGNFRVRVIQNSWLVHPESIQIIDVDEDGLPDIVAGIELGHSGSRLVWYKNLDYNEFSSENVLSGSNPFSSVIAGDLNLDGKDDLVYVHRMEKKLYWQRKTTGSFASKLLIDDTSPLLPNTVSMADVDGNGSTDLLVGFVHGQLYNPGEIILYRNTAVMGVEEPTTIEKTIIYPNPVESSFEIKSASAISKISVYDFTGRKVLEKSGSNHLDMSNEPSGLYIVKIEDISGNTKAIKIVKN